MAAVTTSFECSSGDGCGQAAVELLSKRTRLLLLVSVAVSMIVSEANLYKYKYKTRIVIQTRLSLIRRPEVPFVFTSSADDKNEIFLFFDCLAAGVGLYAVALSHEKPRLRSTENNFVR